MKTSGYGNYALSVSLAAVLLAGCGLRQAQSITPQVAAKSLLSANGPRSQVIIEALHNFRNDPDGAYANAGVIGEFATLYGTTAEGGASSYGTVFAASTAAGRELVLHSFSGTPDGAYPLAELTPIGSDLYGTTGGGGQYGVGTIFKISKAGGEHVLHSFGYGSDGMNADATLLRVGANLYSTTFYGGSSGNGTVFETSATGAERVLYSFGDSGDGANPSAGLTQLGGTLYGTTRSGGAYGGGTVFAVTTSGSESVLHSIGSGSDGSDPYLSGLTAFHDKLYGTTNTGGTYGDGTVFSIDPVGNETVVYSFGASTGDGTHPYAGVIVYHNKLYGAAYHGGAYGGGALFSVTAAGKERVLHSLSGGPEGDNPLGALRSLGNWLYGTSSLGGKGGAGAIYRISP